jgi:hypothetical protein
MVVSAFHRHDHVARADDHVMHERANTFHKHIHVPAVYLGWGNDSLLSCSSRLPLIHQTNQTFTDFRHA